MRGIVTTQIPHSAATATTAAPAWAESAEHNLRSVKDACGGPTIVINAISALLGGGQTYLVNLLRFLPPDFSSRIYIMAPDTLLLPTNDERIVRISIPGFAIRSPYIRAFWERARMQKVLSSVGAGILFCPGGIIEGSVPSGCRAVMTFQNMIPFSPEQKKKYGLSKMRLRNWILGKEFRRSMARADLVICLSDYAKKVAESEINDRLKSVVTIPHGVSPVFRSGDSPVPAPPAWLPASGYFLYVSTLDHYKAQVEVLRAFSLLKSVLDVKEKLVFVGPEYPEYGARVRDVVKALRLENEVLIHAAVPYRDMPAVYRNAALNIFASECENCPNVLIEALAAGRPVLSSNVPPMPEIAGTAAVYFDPKSPNDLAEKWHALLTDGRRMKEMAARAEERSRLYNWPETARRTWEAISELAKR
jgi:glycosyltransferase involved in cell wall biosynthesis